VPTSTPRSRRATQGHLSSYTNWRGEPTDHAIGRFRGGLSTKIHHLADGKGRPLVMLVGPGQGGDSRCSPICCPFCTRSEPDPDGHAADLIGCWATRPTPLEVIGHWCARCDHRGDPRTRRPARTLSSTWSARRATGELRHRGPTRTATSSSDPSTSSSTGAAWPLATTSSHSPTTGRRPLRHHHLAMPIGRHVLAEDLLQVQGDEVEDAQQGRSQQSTAEVRDDHSTVT
jgi:hypothetical protein